MKFILVCLSFLFALQSNAQVVKTCSSIHDEIPSIELILDESQIISKVLMGGSTFFEVDSEKHEVGFYDDVSTILENYALGLHLKKHALITEEYASVQATLITILKNTNSGSRWGTTFEQQMEKLSDDASGVAMLEFYNKENILVGSSILVGWGGVFNNCL